MYCPYHLVDLVGRDTVYGRYHQCPQPWCTVACWSGPTSYPADDETRQLRAQCHDRFDPLWQRQTMFASRTRAYDWLARTLFLKRYRAHIGYLDADQCRELLEHLDALDWLASFGQA